MSDAQILTLLELSLFTKFQIENGTTYIDCAIIMRHTHDALLVKKQNLNITYSYNTYIYV